jgi:hypothetical protein
MEQPCYKCGQLVEEGRVFCPHCMAPQIRVVVAEPVTTAFPASQLSATTPDQVDLPATETLPVLALPLGWSQALKPSALAALVVLVLMLLGLSPLVAMPIVGFLAVIFSRQGRPDFAIKTGAAMRLGAFSGLFCFGMITLLTSLAAAVPELRTKLHEGVLRNAERWAAARPNDLQIQAAIEQLKTPEGFMAVLIVGGIMLFVLSIVLGALGGFIGASVNRRRR